MRQDGIQSIASIFSRVCDLPDAERNRILDRECAGDEAARMRVMALLRADAQPPGPLDSPALGTGFTVRSVIEEASIPKRLGRFEILSVLGQGGMGTVYLARQERPSRNVALKVLRGVVSPKQIRRFQLEAEALGRLQHPGIAQIYEAGVAECITEHDRISRPYLCMELIHGQRLTTFVQNESLTIRQRIQLMLLICDAVHHAHQRGIIHRDLKPANILVADSPLVANSGSDAALPCWPKILDFGVARITHPDGRATTVQTGIGQLVGTLPYMSPEQVDGDPRDLDVRSDVYSLGVVLFEALTGSLPHDVDQKTIAEAAMTIRRAEPKRLIAIDDAFRGDLDTIVAKAMHKDRSQRYQSAADFAEDLRRYLNDQPILARGDSIRYLVRKHLKRHRVAAAAVAAILILILGFAAYAGIQARRFSTLAAIERDARIEAQNSRAAAMSAEAKAAAQRDAAQRARDAESLHRQTAEREAARARIATGFLIDMLAMADPDEADAFDAGMIEFVDQAADAVGVAFAGQPAEEAAVRAVIGRTYAALGRLDLSRIHLDRAMRLRLAMDDQSPDELYEVLWTYYNVLLDIGEVIYGPPASIVGHTGRQLIAAAHPDLGAELVKLSIEVDRRRPLNMADRVQRLIAIAERELSDDPVDWILLADQLFLFGRKYWSRFEDNTAAAALLGALDIYRLHLPETNSRVLRTQGKLVEALIRLDRFGEAEALCRKAGANLAAVLPEDHWLHAVHRARLGHTLIGLGRFAEAEALLVPAYGEIVSARGPSGVFSTQALIGLIGLYDEWNRQDDESRYRLLLAESLARSVVHQTSETAAPAFGSAESDLLDQYMRVRFRLRDSVPEAGAELDQFLAARRQRLPDQHILSELFADIFVQRAAMTYDSGRRAEIDLAEKLLREAVHIFRVANVTHPRKRAHAPFQLADLLHFSGRSAEAEPLARECLTVRSTGPDERFGFIAAAQSLLGIILVELGRADEAEPILQDAYSSLAESLGSVDYNTMIAMSRLARSLVDQHRNAEASELCRQYCGDIVAAGTQPSFLRHAARQVALRNGLSPVAYEAALDALDRAAPSLGDSEVALARGCLFARLGRNDEAIQSLREVTHLNSTQVIPEIAFLALAYAHSGRSSDAGRLIARAHEVLAEHSLVAAPDTRLLLSEVVQALGEIEVADSDHAGQ